MTDGARPARLRVVAGDAYPDWEAVYADNVVGIYRFVFARVGNRPDAEDLTEEVFLAALPRLRLPRSSGEVRGYLLATARTVLVNHWRRHYGSPAMIAADPELLVLPAPGEPPAETAEARAQRILGGLPERFRRVLELRFLRGLSVREVAVEMGVSEANARVLQHRALRLAALRSEGGLQ